LPYLNFQVTVAPFVLLKHAKFSSASEP
jgi:hypothetical protein